MLKLLIFLVIIASVGKIKCQDTSEDGLDPNTDSENVSEMLSRRDASPDAFKAGCPPGKERENTTGRCVKIVTRRGFLSDAVKSGATLLAQKAAEFV